MMKTILIVLIAIALSFSSDSTGIEKEAKFRFFKNVEANHSYNVGASYSQINTTDEAQAYMYPDSLVIVDVKNGNIKAMAHYRVKGKYFIFEDCHYYGTDDKCGPEYFDLGMLSEQKPFFHSNNLKAKEAYISYSSGRLIENKIKSDREYEFWNERKENLFNSMSARTENIIGISLLVAVIVVPIAYIAILLATAPSDVE